MTSRTESITQIADWREIVEADYNSEVKRNKGRFNAGNDNATAEYIFPNQIQDAIKIVDEFYTNKRRVIMVQKKTKVGADGLMIETARLLTTHKDDSFVVNPDNVRILTGMSNVAWEKDMIDKSPTCFKDKIFHHGKLSKSELANIRNGLIIIDEIDTGDKEYLRLHDTLKEVGLLDVNHMKEHNNRLVLISATMIQEIYDVSKWGDLQKLYTMTIPESYIGHKHFLDKGIIQEFYPLDSKEATERWIQEDILLNYATDYRVHIVRLSTNGKIRNVGLVQDACIRNDIIFRNHTSEERLSEDEINEFFIKPLKQHIVLGVKGLLRRANLIPNRWKLRIGAMHELYTKKVDNNVQIQGLVGRMTGYWRVIIESGHKTGPYRTSITAIEEYEHNYNNPFGLNSYQTTGFKKKKGIVSSNTTSMLSPKHIANLVAVDLPVVEDLSDPTTIPIVIQITKDQFTSIRNSRSRWNFDIIFECMEPSLRDELKRINNMPIDHECPDPEKSGYSKKITDYVNSAKSNKKRKTWATEITKNPAKDYYVIYLDQVDYRIIVSIYYGSKTIAV